MNEAGGVELVADGEGDPEAHQDADLDAGRGADVTFALLGGPDDGPTLDLDHRQFAYAGKFVVSGTGKAVVRAAGSSGDGEDREVLAAAAFDRDRTDESVVRVRYVTVRSDRRGEGLGARLLASLAERVLAGDQSGGAETAGVGKGGTRTGDTRTADAATRVAETEDGSAEGSREFEGAREVRIAVNNAFAYEAAFKAGFGFTGERTGLAELLCARPGDRSAGTYRDGLEAFLAREDLTEAERAFVDERRDAGPPATVAPLPNSGG